MFCVHVVNLKHVTFFPCLLLLTPPHCASIPVLSVPYRLHYMRTMTCTYVCMSSLLSLKPGGLYYMTMLVIE